MLSRIRKDDLVMVLAGRDKGKTGVVLFVDSKKNVATVQGICIVKKHLKARKSGEKSRIAEEEASVPLCKIMPVCKSCKKACRVQVKELDGVGENKVRVCCRCREAL